MQQSARDYLTNLYLEWLNEYLSVAKWAEHHGLTEEQGLRLLNLANEIADSEHPAV